MSIVLTLADRRRQKLEAMRAALDRIDPALAGYARDRGGRFIRFGSSAIGALRPESDVDLIADFADDRAALAACRFADEVCASHAMQADSRPAFWVSDRILARALAEGVILA